MGDQAQLELFEKQLLMDGLFGILRWKAAIRRANYLCNLITKGLCQS